MVVRSWIDRVATRTLYLTNAKKMHTPGSPGYVLNRILFAPKSEQEKGASRWLKLIHRGVPRIYGPDQTGAVEASD